MSDIEKPSVRVPTPRLVESASVPAPSAGAGPSRDVNEVKDTVRSTHQTVAENAKSSIHASGNDVREQEQRQQMTDAEALAKAEECRTDTSRVQGELPGKLLAALAVGFVVGTVMEAVRRSA